MGGRLGGDWNGGRSAAIWSEVLSQAMAHGNNTGGGGDGAKNVSYGKLFIKGTTP